MRPHARLQGARVGEGRRHLPDLPRPLPQRPAQDNDPDTGDVRYDDPVVKLGLGRAARGLLPQLRGRVRDHLPVALRQPADAASTSSSRAVATTGRRPQGRRPAARLPRAARRHTVYFNPIFDAGSNHTLRHAGLHEDRPVLRHPEGLREPRQARERARDPDHPRRRVQPHVVATARCSTATTTTGRWARASRRRRRTASLVRLHRGRRRATARAPATGRAATSAALRRLVRVRLDPGADKTDADVQTYFLTAAEQRSPSAGSRRAPSGWRHGRVGRPVVPGRLLGDRSATSSRRPSPNALTISETWQKDSTLLRMIRGDRLDTTMNYRLRDAVLGVLAPGTFDCKGFGDSGHADQRRPTSPTGSRRSREDYPDAAYYSLDEPARQPRHRATALDADARPGDTAARQGARRGQRGGRQAPRAARLPDPVHDARRADRATTATRSAMTGDDDPDDRRTYPWADLGGSPDTAMLAHYTALADAPRRPPRADATATSGSCSPNDADGTVGATAARPARQAAIVVVNRSDVSAHASTMPGRRLPARRHVGSSSSYAVGTLGSALGRGPTAAPSRSRCRPLARAPPGERPGRPGARRRADRLRVDERGQRRGLGRLERGLRRAAGYDVWVSPVSGGGYVKVNAAADHRHVLHDHRPAQRAGGTTSSSARSTPPATRAPRPTRSSACHTTRSAGPTSSGRRR